MSATIVRSPQRGRTLRSRGRGFADAPQPRSHARAVPLSSGQSAKRAGSSLGFIVLCVAVLAASLIGVLLLNIAMAEGAYEYRDLRTQRAALQEQKAETLALLDSHAAPQFLAESARALGMVPATRVGFVSLEQGVVAGHRGTQ